MPLSRGASPALLAALGGTVYPVLLTYADWPGGAVRVHTGRGNIVWDGQTWIGGGRFVAWEAPAEEVALAALEAAVRVSATLEAILAELGKEIRGRAVRRYFGVTTTPGGSTLASTPVLDLAGTFSGRDFAFSPQAETGATHDLTLQVSLGPWLRASASQRHSHEDQIKAYSTDTAGRHLQNLAKMAVNPPQWPEP